MYCGWILKNGGIQKTVNATAPFSMGSLDISGFEGQQFLNICWRYHSFRLRQYGHNIWYDSQIRQAVNHTQSIVEIF